MTAFRDLSIKRKLTMLMMLTSCAALLLACVSFMTYELVTMRQTMAQELKTLAGIIADNSTAALSFRDSKAAEETLGTLANNRQIVAAAIYGPDGAPFARYLRSGAREDAIPRAPQGEGYRFEAGHLILFGQVLMDQDRIGTVYLQSDLGLMVARIQRYLLIVLAVLGASAILALLLASRLQGVISEPILDLVEVTRLVASERNYAVRAPRRSRDEVGLLIDGFNDMLGQIQLRDGALETARDDLEKRVRERTLELQQQLAYIQLLRRVAALANETSTIEEPLQACLDAVCGLIRWPVGHVTMRPPDQPGVLIPLPIWHLDDPERFMAFREITEETILHVGEGLPGRVVADGRPTWISDITQAPHASAGRDLMVRAGFGVPVVIGEEVAAVLEFFTTTPMPQDEKLLQVMAQVGIQL